MPFEKGVSGNPNGRPPLSAALSDTLRTIAATNHGRSRRDHNRILAETVWQLVTTLSAKLPNGEIIRADTFGDWFGLVKWLADRTEGRPFMQPDPIWEARLAEIEARLDERE